MRSPPSAVRRQRPALRLCRDPAVALPRIGQGDGEFAGKMVVAGARVAQRRVPGAEQGSRPRPRSETVGEAEQGFDCLGDFAGGEPVIAVPPLFFRGDQRRRAEPGEMGAGGLRSDAGGGRQLARAAAAAVEQGDQHQRARGVADRGGDVGQGVFGSHDSMLVEALWQRKCAQSRHFPRRRPR